ncbi:MAG TPA: ABC transporter ATP-binding protein [Pseudoxanthomonas sp.]
MSSDNATAASASREVMISASGLSKCYQIYQRPSHRLLQALVGRYKKLYDEFWALQGVDLEIRRGETLGIIGRNGSGKSTLLQLIAGTLTPTTGSVSTNGRVAALLELGSGFNPEFTGRENVQFNATILGLTPGEIAARMDRILAFAEIGGFIDQPVKNYSSGMMMRLAFSVMVHVDADVLIIDEALAVGDTFFTQKCMRFLREFKERGTLLFVSHDSAAVVGLCDRAIWLDNGKLCASGSAKDVVNQYLEAFLTAREGRALAPVPGVGEGELAQKRPRRDFRQPLIDRSRLRNDIDVIPFDPDAAGFGGQKARVVDVALLDEEGKQLPMIVGGETVVLEIVAEVADDFDSPIVGFYLRDRLGQLLFGDNTYISYAGHDVAVSAGRQLRAKFKFDMPRLAAGDYHFTIGIANGTQEDHSIQHWLHEALHIKSQGQGLPVGIVGLPMQEIVLEQIDE